MKISELIRRLERIKIQEGDINVELSIYFKGNEVPSEDFEVYLHKGNEEEMTTSFVELYGTCTE